MLSFNSHRCLAGFTFPVTEFYLEDVLEMTNFSFVASRQNVATQPVWRQFSRRGKEESEKIRHFENMVGPFLRDISTSGRYSKSTIDSLACPESEDINLELIAVLVRHIHYNQDDGAVLVFLPGEILIGILQP